MQDLLNTAKTKAQQWLSSPAVDADTKKEVEKLLQQGDNALINAFYKELEFGTGGLRGLMGVGSNCMNQYTIGIAAQGLANYLKKSFSGKISAAIAYDSRNNSFYFAQITANILSANGIHVYLSQELRPTPFLSFAIRQLNCQSGVVITASHNPKEYNGFKAYWNDGGQLVPPHDKNVITEVNAIEGFDAIKFSPDKNLIHPIPKETEDAYYKNVVAFLPETKSLQASLNIPIAYSSIHGAGITMVPECLKRLGFTNVHVVEEQRVPNGNFPTVKSPNPEEQSAMKMVLDLAASVQAEIVMATDPDTDRVGIGIKNDEGNYFLLSGNQALSLMVYHILKIKKERANAYIAKTIVTTDLIDTMAAANKLECINTLTGFKYIAELMREREGKNTFLVAGEESYGYLIGDFVRDKDAVSACAFFAWMAANAKATGKSLYDVLVDMYVEYGYYREGVVNITKEGASGAQQIKDMMNHYRTNTPTTWGDEKIVAVLDYKTGEKTERGIKSKLHFPSSDVLQFFTENGSKISVRPSGTEPKIKFYISVHQALKSKADFTLATKQLDERIQKLKQAIQ